MANIISFNALFNVPGIEIHPQKDPECIFKVIYNNKVYNFKAYNDGLFYYDMSQPAQTLDHTTILSNDLSNKASPGNTTATNISDKTDNCEPELNIIQNSLAQGARTKERAKERAT
eukprot:8146272-Ditylum_brightwellii.AAC.1